MKKVIVVFFLMSLLTGCKKETKPEVRFEPPEYVNSEHHFLNTIKVHPGDRVELTGYSQTIKTSFLRKTNTRSIQMDYISNDTHLADKDLMEKVADKIEKAAVSEISNHRQFDVIEVSFIINGEAQGNRTIKMD